MIDALLLSIRLSLPIFITHAVLEAASRPVALADIPDPQAAQKQEPQTIPAPEIAKETPLIQPPPALTLRSRYELYERIWPFLLAGLVGAQETLDPAQIGALDLASELCPHRIIWEQQPMIALRVPDPQRTAWLLVQPEVWSRTATAASNMGFVESGVLTTPVTFSSTVRQQVDAYFERLLINHPVETVLLSQPDGTLFTWKSVKPHVEVNDLSRRMVEDRARVKNLASRRPKPHLLTFSSSFQSFERSKQQTPSRPAEGKTSQIVFSVYGGTLGIVFSSPQPFGEVMDSLQLTANELQSILATADDIS